MGASLAPGVDPGLVAGAFLVSNLGLMNVFPARWKLLTEDPDVTAWSIRFGRPAVIAGVGVAVFVVASADPARRAFLARRRRNNPGPRSDSGVNGPTDRPARVW